MVTQKTVADINDGLDAIVLLQTMKACHDTGAKYVTLNAASLLYIQDGGQITLLQRNVVDIVGGLQLAIDMGQEEMVGSTHETIGMGQAKTCLKLLVAKGLTLGGLEYDKGDGMTGETCLGQLLPIDITLMMRYVNAIDFVVGRHIRVADIVPEETKKDETSNEQ